MLIIINICLRWYHPTRYHLKQKKKWQTGKNGLTMSLSRLKDHSLKLRHSTETYGGCWAVSLLCSIPVTTLSHGDDDDEIPILIFIIVTRFYGSINGEYTPKS